MDIARHLIVENQSTLASLGGLPVIADSFWPCDGSPRRVAAALAGNRPPRAVLIDFATNLLTLLLGERSLAINRAAINSPELARALLTHGRHTTGPMVERYLTRLIERGELAIDDAVDAFRLLYGLVVQDMQIRALLGEAPPGPDQLAAHATKAVERFLTLTSFEAGERRSGAPSSSGPNDASADGISI